MLLYIDDHIVSVPLAAVLHILNKSVADLTDFDPCQNLRDLGLFDAIPTLLEVFERFIQGAFFEL